MAAHERLPARNQVSIDSVDLDHYELDAEDLSMVAGSVSDQFGLAPEDIVSNASYQLSTFDEPGCQLPSVGSQVQSSGTARWGLLRLTILSHSVHKVLEPVLIVSCVL